VTNSLVNKAPTLLIDGDEIEQTTWPQLRQFVPHYEQFWQCYVYPLRSYGSIYFRPGIDEEFEWLASLHYSMYVALGRGYDKIAKASEDFKFFEEIYASLYRASELAGKVIEQFCAVYRGCLQGDPDISHRRRLDDVQNNLRLYRNLLHEGIRATKKAGQRRLIPKRDCLERYDLWSRVRYGTRDEDFVPVEQQLWQDFQSLCSAIEDVWKQMASCHDKLRGNKTFQRRIKQGADEGASVTGVPAVSGTIIARSDQW